MPAKNTPKIFGIPEPMWLQRIDLPNWLLYLLTLIFIFRIPTFFEPYYYGDEMIYLAIGNGLRNGLLLYKDLFDHKTPILYYIAMFAGNLFWFKVILSFWMLITTAFFYKLVSHFFPKNVAVTQVAVITFSILTTIPLLEGNTVNAELFMIGPVIVSFYLLLSRKHTAKLLLLSGLVFSIAPLLKMPSLLDIGVILLFWLITKYKKHNDLIKILKDSLILLSGITIPFLIFILWFSFRGSLNEFVFSALIINFDYINSWGQTSIPSNLFANPQLVRLILVIIGNLIIFIFRKKLSKPFIFASIWILLALFSATLSERPYPHYLIQIVPAVSILIGMLIAYPSIEQSLTIIPLLVSVFVINYFGYWYYPTGSYYKNFADFALGKKDKWEYYKEFTPDVSRNYSLSEFLKLTSKPEDNVFIWGDSPVIYALSKRLPNTKYLTDFHIMDYTTDQEFLKIIKDADMIVIMPNAKQNMYLKKHIREYYFLFEEIEGARIYKKMSPIVLKQLN